tara:strand:- start:721 stop:951 length:231 start_codon:yes stop_codon:yes gene_type:complete
MCIGGGGSSSPPPPTQEEKDAEMERESAREQETAKRREARQDVLEENIANIRRGTGRRSLLRGRGGGIGFFNRYNL